jgi:hypothetical protein
MSVQPLRVAGRGRRPAGQRDGRRNGRLGGPLTGRSGRRAGSLPLAFSTPVSAQTGDATRGAAIVASRSQGLCQALPGQPELADFNERNPQRDVVRFALGPACPRAKGAPRIRLAPSQQRVALARLADGSR